MNLKTRIRQKSSKWITFTFLLVTFIAVLGFLLIVLSFYTINLCNFIFFVTSFTSYIISPVLNGFVSSWFDFIVSFFRIILTCPFIQFYIFFIMKSVLSVVDLFGLFPQLGKDLFLKALKGHSLNSDNLCIMLCTNIIFIILLAIIVLIFISAFYFPYIFMIPGMILYLKIVTQILFLMTAVAIKWINILSGQNFDQDEKIYKFYERGKSFFFRKKQVTNSNPTENDSSGNNSPVKDERESFSRSAATSSDDDKATLTNLLGQLGNIFSGFEYEFFYTFAKEIQEDQQGKSRNRITLAIIVFFNLFVIIADFVKVSRYSNENIDVSFFLVSIFMRLLFLPLTSYFNFVFSIFYYDKFEYFTTKLVFLAIPCTLR